MNRRDFVLGGAAVASLSASAFAQSAPRLVGVLGVVPPAQFATRLSAFRDALARGGFAEGRDIRFDVRTAETGPDAIAAHARELVALEPAIVLAGGDPVATAMKRATSRIPVVFVGGASPVEMGLVSSLSRPGGNLTGVTNLNIELLAKRCEIIAEMTAEKPTIGFLTARVGSDVAGQIRAARETCARLGRRCETETFASAAEIPAALADLSARGAGAVVIGASPYTNPLGGELGRAVAAAGLPAIFTGREFTKAGGLAAYGASVVDQYRLAGEYAARILRGDHPSDLPVQQSSVFEFSLNLPAAKALGVTIPLPLLARADEVIE